MVLYQTVAQSTLRMCEGLQVYKKKSNLTIAVDVNNCLYQII